jgi:restriction endonuclease S subunit
MCRVRPLKNVDSEFLAYHIGSEHFRYYIDISKTDPMIPHITQKNIFDFIVPLPSLKEQKRIVNKLTRQVAGIDELSRIETQRIDILKEYRQSLISEVVTGKICVLEELSPSGQVSYEIPIAAE